MRRTLTDPTITYNVFVRSDIEVSVKRFQFLNGLEGAVFIYGLNPGNIFCPRYVPTPLRMFHWIFRWCSYLSIKLLLRADVYQTNPNFLEGSFNIIQISSYAFIGSCRNILCWGWLWLILSVWTVFRFPLFSTTVHYPDFFMAKIFENPKSKSCKPVIKITI